MADYGVYLNRWAKTRKLMEKAGVSALLLVPTTDLFYLTAQKGHINDRLTCFLLTASEAFFICPGFEKPTANKDLLLNSQPLVHSDGDDPCKMLTDLIAEKGGSGLTAVDTRIWGGVLLTLQERLPKQGWVDAAQIIRPLRMQKDEEEYQLLKKAQLLAGQALSELYKWGLEGRTEKEAAAQLTEFCTRAGLDKADWGPTVGSGPNGASPHHGSSDKIIARGDPVVIDFGGVYYGYQADMTRTPVIGKAKNEFKEVYQIVLQANEAAFKAPRPGLPCEQVDAAARYVIQQAGYGEFFTHRLGHGIGLDIHEDPYMVKGNTLPLAAGMSFSDEPGIYLPGNFGIRIEDILFMKENGVSGTDGGANGIDGEAERLTGFPHTLTEL
jgi:Xaa-Pro aminopeptidase